VTDRLEDLLRSCVVRVTGGPAPGAGFFIAPGRVVTCVHVVENAGSLTVRWERDGQRSADFAVSDVRRLADGGRPIPALASDYPDIAVLTVAGISGHSCVAIDPGWPGAADAFQAFGYPSEGGAVLLTPARLTYRGLRGTWPALFLDLGWDTIKHGMSGAPVLNLRTGGVCGVVVASRDPQQPSGALAVPWSAVETDLDDVLAENAAFHRRDGQWARLRQLAGKLEPSGTQVRAGAGGAAVAGAAGWAAGAAHGHRHQRPGSGPPDDDDDAHHHEDDGHHHEDDVGTTPDDQDSDPDADSAPDDVTDDDLSDTGGTDDDDLW
jgi:hypothetical protein